MWAAVGMAGVSMLGNVMGNIKQNKALKAQSRARKSVFIQQASLTKFAIDNNIQKANEIASQQADEAAEMSRQVDVAERQAVGSETIRRGEGLTAGASVERSVDEVIQQGNQAKAQVVAEQEKNFMNVQGQARQANAKEQAQHIANFQSMVSGINSDNMQISSGLEMLLSAAGSGAQGAGTGATIQSAFGS